MVELKKYSKEYQTVEKENSKIDPQRDISSYISGDLAGSRRHRSPVWTGAALWASNRSEWCNDLNLLFNCAGTKILNKRIESKTGWSLAGELMLNDHDFFRRLIRSVDAWMAQEIVMNIIPSLKRSIDAWVVEEIVTNIIPSIDKVNWHLSGWGVLHENHTVEKKDQSPYSWFH